VNDAIAIAAAIGAAMTFAGSAVEQQKAAATAPEDASLKPRLVLDLAHRRPWLLGIGGMIVAYVLQAVALGFSDVSLVEPVVATELVFAVPLAIRARRQHPGVREWAGCALVAGGVATFLISAHPGAGHPHAGAATWLLALLPAVGAVAGLLVLARGPQTRARAMLLGAAAGIANGMVALVTKSFTVQLGHGVPGAFASWQLYTIFAFGAAGFLFAQSAYQAAPLANSLPVMDALEPLSSIVIAAGVLGEYVDLTPLHVVFELVGAVAALGGVWLLGRSPVVLSIYEQQQERREGTGEPRRTDAPAGGESGAAAKGTGDGRSGAGRSDQRGAGPSGERGDEPQPRQASA
jgi:drug/metabolite transporter (DMT)-like permease